MRNWKVKKQRISRPRSHQMVEELKQTKNMISIPGCWICNQKPIQKDNQATKLRT
jgi:hypothetical protein